jgi:nucleotide-binding universal stress UspA family protein
MLERILVPLDGSETSEAVLPQVRRLLMRKDAEVFLLQVAEVDYLPTYESSRLRVELPELAQQYVRRLARRLEEDGVRTRPLVATGAPAPEILAAAAEHKVSLIAMATHGRTGLSRWTLGSVTEKLLRASPVPVLAMRSFPAPAPAERTFRKLLVPVDGSDRSREVMPCASEFALHYDAEILVVTVADPAAPPEPAVQERLDSAVGLFRSSGNRAAGVLLHGDPAAQIVDICPRENIDLAVMATHGRSGPLRWMLGSVTEKVLRAATVPMLVVRTRNERL